MFGFDAMLSYFQIQKLELEPLLVAAALLQKIFRLMLLQFEIQQK
jgi:hypothetical protein